MRIAEEVAALEGRAERAEERVKELEDWLKKMAVVLVPLLPKDTTVATSPPVLTTDDSGEDPMPPPPMPEPNPVREAFERYTEWMWDDLERLVAAAPLAFAGLFPARAGHAMMHEALRTPVLNPSPAINVHADPPDDTPEPADAPDMGDDDPPPFEDEPPAPEPDPLPSMVHAFGVNVCGLSPDIAASIWNKARGETEEARMDHFRALCREHLTPPPVATPPVEAQPEAQPAGRRNEPERTIPADWEPEEAQIAHGVGLGATKPQIAAAAREFKAEALKDGRKTARWGSAFRAYLTKRFGKKGGA